jgi:predicted metalloprotease with PDZ domain
MSGEKKPGDTIHVTVFRFDDLRTFDIRLGARVDAPFRIVPLPKASDEQKRIYQAWLGAH